MLNAAAARYLHLFQKDSRPGARVPDMICDVWILVVEPSAILS